jgi:hypothetical protein
MEAAGIEPASDSDATPNPQTVCISCPQCGAAYALHLKDTGWREVAVVDADLQAVLQAWGELPVENRKAILSLSQV